jgi:tetratricopeptide (TPR) repeat protein
LAVHRTILIVDVERFSATSRTDHHRVAIRAGLYRTLITALSAIAVPWTGCDHEDRGDGVLVIISPMIPKSVLVDDLPKRLVAELTAHNVAHDEAERIRLRMALHAGEVRYDDHGVVGTSVNHTFRLLDAAIFKAAFAQTDGPLGVIASSWFFEEVVRHSEAATPSAYRRIHVIAKETDTTGWIYFSGSDAVEQQSVESATPKQLPPSDRHFVGRETELAGLDAFWNAHDTSTVAIAAIAGAGGVGKTTLAARWAHDIRRALYSLARAVARLKWFDEAENLIDQAAALADGVHAVYRNFGLELAYAKVFELENRHAEALHHAELAWKIAQNESSLHCRADALTALAWQRTGLGQPGEALPLAKQAVSLYREFDHEEGKACAQSALGAAYHRLGRYEDAIDCLAQALTIDRQLGAQYWEAHALNQIGDLQDLLGLRDSARASWQEAAMIFARLNHPEGAEVRTKLGLTRQPPDGVIDQVKH